MDEPPTIESLSAEIVRLRAQVAELRSSEERQRVLFDCSPLPTLLFELEPPLRIVAANEAASRAYGYSRDELLTLTVPDLKFAEDVPGLLERMKARRESPARIAGWRGVQKHRRKDGSVVEMDISGHEVIVEGRRNCLAISVDVTETRRAEQQLRQSHKMDAIGQLAGGVAHDFNNMLAVILADAQFALAELPDGHPAAADIAEISLVAGRAAALTRQLLVFSRQQPAQRQVLALNTIVTGVENMVARILGDKIALSFVTEPRLGAIEADPGHLEQVLVNLAMNAREAMPSGGKLTIATRNVVLDAARAAHLELTPGPHVALVVTDTGCGMDEATRDRVFDPFFTTKDVGQGPGLGLSAVFGIVKESGGAIATESFVGFGTTFTVFFPARALPADAERGDETLLLVEDDEHVRGIVRRLLEERGYKTVVASSAKAALGMLDAVDLVVTDLVMPDMDGRAMTMEIRAAHPKMKVLYMSGFTAHAAMRGHTLGPDDHFIQKPFDSEQLALAVRAALD